jgi:tetratricopeptide (TPR) repeat protein
MLEDAINAYGRAIEKDKMYVEPLLGRARVRQRRREWTEAMLDCEAARQLEPERAEAWWRIGDSLYELGKKKDAVTPYREALARDSKNAEVHFKLGRTYYDIDKPREALASLREAVRLAPPDAEWFPDAVLKLGYTLRAVGSRGEACGMFVKYMEVAPETAAGRGDVKQILLGCP